MVILGTGMEALKGHVPIHEGGNKQFDSLMGLYCFLTLKKNPPIRSYYL